MTSLLQSISFKIATNGADMKLTITAPINVLGTTPGKSRWSY